MIGGSERRRRVVVIGCGAIAEEHLRYLATSRHVELHTVCDLSPALAELARDRYGAKEYSTDVDNTLSSARPDVVHVLTPPATHPGLVRRALAVEAHVICEKPLAPTAGETAAILACARSAQVHVIETRNLLYNDVVRELARRVGDPSDVREIDVSLALDLGSADVPPGGLGLPLGIAHDYLPHLAYLLLHFASVPAVIDQVVGLVGNESGRSEIGVDHVDVLVRLGAVRARVRISPDVRPTSLRLVVRTLEQTLEADIYQPYVRREGSPWTGKFSPFGMMVQGASLAGAGARNLRDRLLQHGTYHGMARMLDAVYDAFAHDRPPPVSEHEMMASAVLIDRIADFVGIRP